MEKRKKPNIFSKGKKKYGDDEIEKREIMQVVNCGTI